MYVLTETVMNGTVVMSYGVTGFDMEFKDAVTKLKKMLRDGVGNNNYEIIKDNNDKFSYEIKGGDFPVYGVMNNKKLTIYTE